MDKLDKSKYNTKDLISYYKNYENSSEALLPDEEIKYVLYARKSTTDENRQLRSIPDQIKECLQAIRNRKNIDGNQIVEIIEEDGSAKSAGQRPSFDKMLEGFRIGRYQGLICWSPDRLARNMKEGGEIIEMIDEHIIQKMLFATYDFEDSPNGKMLLGILFATSKQYSDKLSIDAKRGVEGNTEDGKYNGFTVPGYCVDPVTKFFLSDGTNWKLLKNAFRMKLYERKTDEEISKYLKENGFSKRKFEGDKKTESVKVTKNWVNKTMKNPFYAGIYKVGNKVVDLTGLYNFEPMITVEEFLKINTQVGAILQGKKDKALVGARKTIAYELLRGKVYCGYCNAPMTMERHKVPKGKNKGKVQLVFYHHDLKNGCARFSEKIDEHGNSMKKTVRTRFIMSGICHYLANCTKNFDKAYDYYIEQIKDERRTESLKERRKIKEAKVTIKELEDTQRKLLNLQLDDLKSYEKYYSGKLEAVAERIKNQKLIKAQSEKKVENLEKELPTKENFSNLIQSYLEILQKPTDIIAQDEVCKKVVSNLYVKNDFVSVINLNPPYNLMVDLTKISSGWG